MRKKDDIGGFRVIVETVVLLDDDAGHPEPISGAEGSLGPEHSVRDAEISGRIRNGHPVRELGRCCGDDHFLEIKRSPLAVRILDGSRKGGKVGDGRPRSARCRESNQAEEYCANRNSFHRGELYQKAEYVRIPPKMGVLCELYFRDDVDGLILAIS